MLRKAFRRFVLQEVEVVLEKVDVVSLSAAAALISSVTNVVVVNVNISSVCQF